MKVGELLTLGLNETKMNRYEVVGYLDDIRDFVVIQIEKSVKDRKLIDIGAISKIEYENVNNNTIKVNENIRLDRYLSKEELNEFLKQEEMKLYTFESDVTWKFAIVKIDYIDEILVSKGEKIDSFIECKLSGKRRKIRIKDFRWLKYWEYIYNQNDDNLLNKKVNHYRSFFNKYDVYVLLYRPVFSGIKNYGRKVNFNNIYWISSIFYIKR